MRKWPLADRITDHACRRSRQMRVSLLCQRVSQIVRKGADVQVASDLIISSECHGQSAAHAPVRSALARPPAVCPGLGGLDPTSSHGGPLIAAVRVIRSAMLERFLKKRLSKF